MLNSNSRVYQGYKLFETLTNIVDFEQCLAWVWMENDYIGKNNAFASA